MTGGMIHDLALSLAMLAMVALLAGAWFLYKRNGPNRQTLLMVVMALVLLGNVAIWQLPPPASSEAASAEGAPPDPAAEAADERSAPPNPAAEAADARSAPAAR